MAVRNIITDPDILTLTSEPVDLDDPSLDDVLEDLRDTAAALGNAAGLAAPQIGYMVRVIWVNVPKRGVMILVNPRILKAFGPSITKGEGCFSVPRSLNTPISVSRRTEIQVEHDTPRGLARIWFNGQAGRIVSHEIDHLDGKLIG